MHVTCHMVCLVFAVTVVTPLSAVTGHELTSVGVAFDPTGNMLASGDMVGRVWLTERDKVEPVHQFFVS